jgi:hypothetical protein
MYSESMVELLLPTVWDRTYAWGVQSETFTPPDMPKAKYKSPKEATTYWTYLIDIRIAWEKAALTYPERRSLLLTYGMGWTEEQVGYNQGVSQQAISKRNARAVERLTRWLNDDKTLTLEDTLIGTS